MSNNIAHFSIHCDDVERGKKFYGEVFGWKFNPYGPPNFYQIQTGNDDSPGLRGAIQERLEPKSDAKPMHGYECTIGVQDLDSIGKSILKNGGQIIMKKAVIPQVGWLIKFEDTEGNIACAMQYDNSAS